MLVYLAMLLHSAISAGTYLAAKRALGEISPFELALLRFTLSAACFGGLLAALRPPRIARRDLLGFVLLGMVAIPINQGLFLYGLSATTPGHASLLYALTPIFVFLLAWLRLGERARWLKLIGIGVAFAGVVLVLSARGVVEVGAPATSTLVGDLWVLLAVIFWAVYSVAGKPYAERYGALASTGYVFLFGSGLYLPFGLALSDSERLASLSLAGWAGVIYLVVITSVVSYLLYYWSLARVEASKVAIFSNLQPVLTAVLAWAVYGERLTGQFVAGGALVLAGVVLTERG
jgi:drug/metabolite transporter (DMT)-like permease